MSVFNVLTALSSVEVVLVFFLIRKPPDEPCEQQHCDNLNHRHQGSYWTVQLSVMRCIITSTVFTLGGRLSKCRLWRPPMAWFLSWILKTFFFPRVWASLLFSLIVALIFWTSNQKYRLHLLSAVVNRGEKSSRHNFSNTVWKNILSTINDLSFLRPSRWRWQAKFGPQP